MTMTPINLPIYRELLYYAIFAMLGRKKFALLPWEQHEEPTVPFPFELYMNEASDFLMFILQAYSFITFFLLMRLILLSPLLL